MKKNIKTKLITNNLQPTTKLGFTLIELLIVIAIIGLLSTLLLANMQGARARARDAQRKNDLKQVKTALRMYYNDNQSYPADNGSGAIAGYSWGSQFGTTPIYMKALPQDPLGTTNYYYDQLTSDTFSLYACLENTSDSDGSVDCGSLTCSSNWCFKVAEE